jgi:hypothetical protein
VSFRAVEDAKSGRIPNAKIFCGSRLSMAPVGLSTMNTPELSFSAAC